MWKAHYVFQVLFSCLTIVRIMGFHDYVISGKCVLSLLFFLIGGKIQDGRHLINCYYFTTEIKHS